MAGLEPANHRVHVSGRKKIEYGSRTLAGWMAGLNPAMTRNFELRYRSFKIDEKGPNR